MPGHISNFPLFIALSHVDLTVNHDAACMYRTRASTMGISYALYAERVVSLLSGVCFGRCYSLGCRAKRHSFEISFSLYPVRMGLPSGENTVTSCFANNTVQSASQIVPTPTRVLVNDGMMYPVFRKSASNCRIGSETVANELSTCPVAVPAQIFGVLVSGGTCGAVGEM